MQELLLSHMMDYMHVGFGGLYILTVWNVVWQFTPFLQNTNAVALK